MCRECYSNTLNAHRRPQLTVASAIRQAAGRTMSPATSKPSQGHIHYSKIHALTSAESFG